MVYGTGGKGASRTRTGWRRGVRAILLTLTVPAVLAAGGCGARRAERAAVQEAGSLPGPGGAVQSPAADEQTASEQPPVVPAAGGESAAGQPASLKALREALMGGGGGSAEVVGVAALLEGRRLVRTADLELEVRNLDAALARIEAIAAGAGGIVTSTGIYSPPGSPGEEPRPLGDGARRSDGSAAGGTTVGGDAAGEAGRPGPPREVSVTVCVPVARFDGALAELRRLGRLVR